MVPTDASSSLEIANRQTLGDGCWRRYGGDRELHERLIGTDGYRQTLSEDRKGAQALCDDETQSKRDVELRRIRVRDLPSPTLDSSPVRALSGSAKGGLVRCPLRSPSKPSVTGVPAACTPDRDSPTRIALEFHLSGGSLLQGTFIRQRTTCSIQKNHLFQFD
jgi:hypothetical protein